MTVMKIAPGRKRWLEVRVCDRGSGYTWPYLVECRDAQGWNPLCNFQRPESADRRFEKEIRR
jgi:hypothetical protein